MKVPPVVLRAVLLASFVTTVVGDPVAHAVEDVTQEFRYGLFVERLNTGQFALDYPGAVKKLDSNDAKIQVAGLMTFSATGELAAIPFIVRLLDSKDGEVRIHAGLALERLVSEDALKRRDTSQGAKIVIRPLDPKDTDLPPLAWVIVKMLQKPDDGNMHAYAASMIGYLDLKEFESHLGKLLKSRHPAVQNAARHALDLMGI